MISIVLPAYQEAENLKKILPKINEELKNLSYEILVIDTVEPMDDTQIVCEENGAKYISRANDNMYGDAIRTGFANALGEYVVIMDADGSHDPGAIKIFWNEMQKGKYDLIIGSRYCKGGCTDNPTILKAMSWILNVTYRLVFGLKVKDVSDSFRMYKSEQVKTIKLQCDNFDIVEEILIRLNYSKVNFSIKEVPITFNKRDKGVSKRNLLKFIFSYIVTMKKLLKIKKMAK